MKATTVYGREALATGNYNVVVMTEGIPLGLDMVEFGGNFHTLAHTSNPNAQTYMFESWHWVTPNPTDDLDPIRYFNENTRAEYRIDTDSYDQIDLLRRHKALWEEKVDAINAAYPQHPDMQIIPTGQVLLRVNEAIIAGDVPGITNIEQLFSDNIHMNDVGNYLVALTHFAIIYNRSPIGLVHQLQSEWGVNFTAPTLEQATVFQRLVWEVVNGTPPAPHSILLVINPNHAGTLNCTPNPVPHGENATCTVNANRGFRFTGFSDDYSGTTCVLTNVTSPRRVTANFSPVPVANDTLPFLDGFE